jgi:Domain of unknown function (DUF4136)
MKSISLRVPFILLMVLVSCEPALKVSSDYDRDASFSKYKTYTYTSEALKLGITDLDRRRILTAIDKEMTAKGFTKQDEGSDVLVDIKAVFQERKEATANTMGPGGYGAGYNYRWGGGFTTTSISVNTYVDGTLIIDIIDANKKQLVWQGRGMRTLDPKSSSDQKEQRIAAAVAAIFKKYPPGQPAK